MAQLQQQHTERRPVEADDPQLSPETNKRVTEELRAVIGADCVEVPADRPHTAHGEGTRPVGIGGWLSVNRVQLLRGAAIALTIGAIVALATGHWWMLAIAGGVHALATMTVALSAIRLTTYSEHPSPEVAAALTEEGVSSPDEYFSRLVDEFRSTPQRGAGEVLSPGENERGADVLADPAEAAAEQSTAMTPTGAPSRSGEGGGSPDFIIWGTIASLFAISIIIPAVDGGGRMWLLTAVMVPLLGGWAFLQRLLAKGGYRIHGARPMIVIAASVAVAVGVFCAIVALSFPH